MKATEKLGLYFMFVGAGWMSPEFIDRLIGLGFIIVGYMFLIELFGKEKTVPEDFGKCTTSDVPD